MPVAGDKHKAGRAASKSRGQPPVATAVRALQAVHVPGENRVLHIAAAEPARSRHQARASHLALVGEPQFAEVYPCAVVVVRQHTGCTVAARSKNALFNDDGLEIVGQIEVHTARRVILVHHVKRQGRAVGNLTGKGVDEQIAVGRKPRDLLSVRRAVVEVHEVHLERIGPEFPRDEVDVIAYLGITVAFVGVDTGNLGLKGTPVRGGKGDVVADVHLRPILIFDPVLNPLPRTRVAFDFIPVDGCQVLTGVHARFIAEDFCLRAIEIDVVKKIRHGNSPSLQTDNECPRIGENRLHTAGDSQRTAVELRQNHGNAVAAKFANPAEKVKQKGLHDC